MNLKINNPSLKLYYDANFSVNQYRGMGKYINYLIDVLKSDFQIVGLLKKNVVKNNFLNFGFSNYILWEQISLSIFNFLNKGVYIFPYNTAPLLLNRNNYNILILHDLIFLEPLDGLTFKQTIGKFYRSIIVKLIINKVDCILTVSEFSKLKIIEKFQISEDKISIIYNTIDSNHNSKILQETSQKYFFHIGGEPSYKNTKSLIYAFALLPDKIRALYSLKILGIKNNKSLKRFKDLAKKLNIIDKIEFLGYKTDLEVEMLYQDASLFLFPSFLEGFGIPLIEAMKYGCPLVISNTSCFPEIAANSATYFDPKCYDTIAQAIVSVLENKNERESKIKIGYELFKKYNILSFQSQVFEWVKKIDLQKIR